MTSDFENSFRQMLKSVVREVFEEVRAVVSTSFKATTFLNYDEIVAEPLFHFRAADIHYACFGAELPRPRIRQRLEDAGVVLLETGQQIVSGEDPT